jgi:hypothetical protein
VPDAPLRVVEREDHRLTLLRRERRQQVLGRLAHHGRVGTGGHGAFIPKQAGIPNRVAARLVG